ncbi:MAG: hypothetical protein IJ412_07760 [Oscillospiraceae bacterium]|nr:hypothetical protein [Oscillospiraceae bacterium]
MSSSVKTSGSCTPVHSLLEIMPSAECHCHHCGALIAEGDARCAACGKKQQVKNTPLLDFLIAHTKEGIADRVTDSLYEAIKDFLLSHLFGVVISLSLAVAVGATVYANEPYIERVQSSGNTASVQFVIDAESDDEYLRRLLHEHYVGAVLYGNAPVVAAIRLDESDPRCAGYELSTGDEQIILQDGTVSRSVLSSYENVFQPERFQSEAAKRITASGYPAAECIFWLDYYDDTGSAAVKRYFLVVFIKTDDGWRVAADRKVDPEVIDLP